MKNKSLRYIKSTLVLGFCALAVSSCLLDDEKTDYGNGPDFVAFSRASITTPVESDGLDHSYDAVIRLIGPNSQSFPGEVTVTVGVDPQNTDAEAGVHYSLPA